MSSQSIIQRVCEAKPQPAGETLPEPVIGPILEDRVAVFARELETLQGELVRVAEVEQAAEELLRLVPPDGRPWFAAGREAVQALAGKLPVEYVGHERLGECQASLTEADAVIADTATVGLRLDGAQPRACHLLAEVHVVIARAGEMLQTLTEALIALERQGGLPTGYVFVTGPSRTADIEKTLVIPAHGPKRLIVVLVG